MFGKITASLHTQKHQLKWKISNYLINYIIRVEKTFEYKYECMLPLPRCNVNTDNAVFAAKSIGFDPKCFTTTQKSTSYPKIYLECKYEGLNVCHYLDIAQVLKTQFFAPKSVNFDPKFLPLLVNQQFTQRSILGANMNFWMHAIAQI